MELHIRAPELEGHVNGARRDCRAVIRIPDVSLFERMDSRYRIPHPALFASSAARSSVGLRRCSASVPRLLFSVPVLVHTEKPVTNGQQRQARIRLVQMLLQPNNPAWLPRMNRRYTNIPMPLSRL